MTIILIAMFAMMITAFSYGRMAKLYPAAGSAYTYMGRGLNPHLGFMAGWAMFLDYLLQSLINRVWIATALARSMGKGRDALVLHVSVFGAYFRKVYCLDAP